MKRQKIDSMSMEELQEFHRKCKIYINDNEQFIREHFESLKEDGVKSTLAQSTIEHYDSTIEAYGIADEILTRCQKQEFKSIAKSYFQ